MNRLVLVVVLLLALLAVNLVSAQTDGLNLPNYEGYCLSLGGRFHGEDGSGANRCVSEAGEQINLSPQLACEFTYPQWVVEASAGGPDGSVIWNCLLLQLKQQATSTPPPPPVLDRSGIGNANPADLAPGDRVQVNGQIAWLNVRAEPGLDAEIVERLQPLEYAYVLSWMFLDDGHPWYRLVYLNREGSLGFGWVSAGTNREAYLIELPHQCFGANPSQLAPTQLIEPTDAFPVLVYANPSGDSQVRGVLRSPDKATALEGPICQNREFWWRIQSQSDDGISGWISEGQIDDPRSVRLVPISYFNEYPANYAVGATCQVDDFRVGLRYAPLGSIIRYVQPGQLCVVLSRPVHIPGLYGYLGWVLVRDVATGYIGWMPFGYNDQPAWVNIVLQPGRG